MPDLTLRQKINRIEKNYERSLSQLANSEFKKIEHIFRANNYALAKPEDIFVVCVKDGEGYVRDWVRNMVELHRSEEMRFGIYYPMEWLKPDAFHVGILETSHFRYGTEEEFDEVMRVRKQICEVLCCPVGPDKVELGYWMDEFDFKD